MVEQRIQRIVQLGSGTRFLLELGVDAAELHFDMGQP